MKLLIGYGNTLRSDDGVGWRIAAVLVPVYAGSDVQVITAHQLLPEIAADVAQAQHVVFVDAALAGGPGNVRVADLHPLDYMEDAHALTASGVLFLAKSLFGQHPPAHLVTITGANFDLGDTLSQAVKSAIPQATDEIRHLLA